MKGYLYYCPAMFAPFGPPKDFPFPKSVSELDFSMVFIYNSKGYILK